MFKINKGIVMDDMEAMEEEELYYKGNGGCR